MAGVSKVFIANLALSKIGTRSKIESLTENSQEASIMDLWYDQARLVSLEGFDWTFARKRSLLLQDIDPPPINEWTFRYVIPNDCVQTRRLENVHFYVHGYSPCYSYSDGTEAIPYDIELSSDGNRRTILTNQGEATLVYTSNVVNVDLFPRHYVNCLASYLAAYAAFDLTGKGSLSDLLEQRAARAMMMAAAHDANSQRDKPELDADWIRARR